MFEISCVNKNRKKKQNANRVDKNAGVFHW